MMSDSDSRDSDDGIRYKTESVRNKTQPIDDNKYVKKSKRKRRSNRSHYLDDKCKRQKRKESRIDKGTSFGPILPPNIKKKTQDILISDDAEQKEIIGPVLPQRLTRMENGNENGTSRESAFVGPVLPPKVINKPSSTTGETAFVGPELPTKVINKPSSTTGETAFVGPELPPKVINKPSSTTGETAFVGPALPPKVINMPLGSDLPPHLQTQNEDTANKTIGPSLPPHLRQKFPEDTITSSDEEEEDYGPLPVDMSSQSKAHRKLEERALQLKIEQLDPKDNKEPVREIWMTELPEAKAVHFGLGPRQFRAKEGPDMSDRSSWTDIAGSQKKEKTKVDIKVQAENREIRKRDKEQELMAKKHKKKNKSLMEIHQQKLEQEKKEAGPSERRPFNRETDLQVNRFDEAQKKAVLKKAQLLDDRFSSGKTKYL